MICNGINMPSEDCPNGATKVRNDAAITTERCLYEIKINHNSTIITSGWGFYEALKIHKNAALTHFVSSTGSQ
jgi:hypothetical protein